MLTLTSSNGLLAFLVSFARLFKIFFINCSMVFWKAKVFFSLIQHN